MTPQHQAADSPLQMGAVTPALLNILFIFSTKSPVFQLLPPVCFQPHAHKLWFLQDKSASISFRLVAQGVPPPDPGAPTPQHSWRINISHTFFQQLLQPFGHAWHQTRTPRCTGGWDPTPWCPKNGPYLQPARPAKSFSVFSLPPDLKIAGNSIFILLSKNFFLSYRAPLPNFRTSRGVPALSSPAFWVRAEMEK